MTQADRSSTTPLARRPAIEPGQRFGRLVALERSFVPGRHAVWRFTCDCGNNCTARIEHVRAGRTTSCGCVRRELNATHGMSHLPEYECWNNMLNRCLDQDHPSFKNYGGRGITVCRRWAGSFEAFYEDVGQRPSVEHSLDRINNERGYEPGNVRWATRREQMRNFRGNHVVRINGESMPLVEACERTGVPYDIARGRLRQGWSVARALNLPTNP
ncbi:hypothetical protein [Methylobacterium aquaticum]|jgi:hypothetical protein|uniref:HNH endonuclease n=1 Tax=Methylobacterium aquaticum TaxID=270351 RepID=A0A0J6T5Z6_9HYPH|nr:hypothetical protein [Methylobacterium aquaticum]KMO40978.1 hypothetical protein VP06_01520 [Methylobacterium aquaticum]